MSLADRLDTIRAGAEKRIPPERHAIMLRATEDLRRSGILERVIRRGATLPAFALPDTAGATVRSADLLARGPLVVTFFRGSW
jgi:hypothetical protein